MREGNGCCSRVRIREVQVKLVELPVLCIQEEPVSSSAVFFNLITEANGLTLLDQIIPVTGIWISDVFSWC